MNDEMWCVIAGENPALTYSCEIYKWYKNPSSALASKIADHKSDKWAGMENQESSVNTEAITAVEINMDPIDNIQSRDIYKVQPGRNKALKSIALNILKYLPEDILREEPDFSSIKSNNTIPDYGPCGECDVPILTEDPPRSLVLNVCGDVIHWTYVNESDKRGVLYCSCGHCT